MSEPVVNIADIDLFGNDAAEDEDDAIFDSYALKRDEVTTFTDSRKKLRIVRAYKGAGKSALLRMARKAIASHRSHPLVISTTGASISPDGDHSDSDKWVRGWKERIFRLIASEIGATIGMAWSDDAISLVEEAERNGFKARSPVSAVVDRLKSSKVPIERTRLGVENAERTLQRWATGKTPVWLFVDDIDQNYQNTSVNKVKIASLFVACRQIINLVPDVRLRLAVRPNVWTAVKPEFEALSHVEQYIVDLTWSEDSIGHLLAQRIEGYLRRSGQEAVLENLREDAYPRHESLNRLVFDAPMRWGNRDKPPHTVLSTLSHHRPRWLVELCRVAAKSASTKNRNRIALIDITGELRAFGQRRIADTIAEFKPQCVEVAELITAFAQQNERYHTDELMNTINRRVLPAVNPHIVGSLGKVTAVDVAAFLFEIGFLTARRELPNGRYEHITFVENPALLRSRTNIDQGVGWEIHPVFREALDLKDKAWDG